MLVIPWKPLSYQLLSPLLSPPTLQSVDTPSTRTGQFSERLQGSGELGSTGTDGSHTYINLRLCLVC